ncbi:hypothetical protein ACGFIK_22185 [Micromonospora sp. NPDC048871]|uniref:hypothetical protein n=1 Tax=Micromonospora sp. NPDC048871 TaxID=3364259 RepID=UPI003715D748
MPTFAFARPLWPAGRCALADLTRLALVALILAVGLGGATAGRPDTTDLPAAPATTGLASRAVDGPLTKWPGREVSTSTGPAVTAAPATGSVVSVASAIGHAPTQPVRALAVTVVSHPEPSEAAAAPAIAVAPRPAVVHLATGAGEPTRRGPPTA